MGKTACGDWTRLGDCGAGDIPSPHTPRTHFRPDKCQRQTALPAHASATGGAPSEGATGGGVGSSAGGGAGVGSGSGTGSGGGKRSQVAGDLERRSDFERQVSTIREQVERVRANLAKAEQYVFWGAERGCPWLVSALVALCFSCPHACGRASVLLGEGISQGDGGRGG